jgi:hypothetical protein
METLDNLHYPESWASSAPVPSSNGSAVATEFMAIWHRVSEEHRELRARCAKVLVSEHGAVAAHPADGWVNKHPGRFHMANPYFGGRRRLQPGDVVALGWTGGSFDQAAGVFRLVRITSWRRWLLALDETHGDYEYDPITGEFSILRGPAL